MRVWNLTFRTVPYSKVFFGGLIRDTSLHHEHCGSDRKSWRGRSNHLLSNWSSQELENWCVGVGPRLNEAHCRSDRRVRVLMLSPNFERFVIGNQNATNSWRRTTGAVPVDCPAWGPLCFVALPQRFSSRRIFLCCVLCVFYAGIAT